MPVPILAIADSIVATQVYEVAPPGPGDNCFRYMDPQRQWLRVHTKHVCTA